MFKFATESHQTISFLTNSLSQTKMLMKKNFTLLILSLLTVATAAAAFPVRLQIDDIARVAVFHNDAEVTTLQSGYNEIDVESGDYLSVASRPGCSLISVTETNVDYASSMPINAEEGRQICRIPTYSDYGDTYVIVSASQADTRTAKCIIKVDSPEKVKVMRTSDESIVELGTGENEFKFDPQTETILTVTPTDKPLYMVTVDGNPAQFNGYSYTVTISEDCTVDIQANYPEKDCAVKFVLSGDDAENFITNVSVDDRTVTDYMSETFSVQAGSELTIRANTTEWEVTECTVNGATAAFSNPFHLIITDATTISISVRKYATFPMTISVDDPSRIHIYRGYSYNKDEFELVAGDNPVNVMRATPIVSLVPADGCFIKTLNADGDEYAPEDLRVSPVMVGMLSDNSKITVTTGVIIRDLEASISVEPSHADGVTLHRSDRTAIELSGEKTSFTFYEGDNPFTLELPAADDNIVVTVDGQNVEPIFPSSPKYDLVLAKGSEVRVGSADYSGILLPNVDNEEAKRIYNIQGMPVDGSRPLPSGLYIINGKKAYIK